MILVAYLSICWAIIWWSTSSNIMSAMYGLSSCRRLTRHLLMHILIISVSSAVCNFMVQLVLLNILCITRIPWWKTTSIFATDKSVGSTARWLAGNIPLVVIQVVLLRHVVWWMVIPVIYASLTMLAHRNILLIWVFRSIAWWLLLKRKLSLCFNICILLSQLWMMLLR